MMKVSVLTFMTNGRGEGPKVWVPWQSAEWCGYGVIIIHNAEISQGRSRPGPQDRKMGSLPMGSLDWWWVAGRWDWIENILKQR